MSMSVSMSISISMSISVCINMNINIYIHMSEYLYNCGIFMADIAIPSSALLSEDRRLEIFPDAEATEVCRPLMSSSALKKAVLFNHICFNKEN